MIKKFLSKFKRDKKVCYICTKRIGILLDLSVICAIYGSVNPLKKGLKCKQYNERRKVYGINGTTSC